MAISLFGSGIHEDMRSKIFDVPTPPDTIEDVLVAAVAAEKSKIGKATRLVNAVAHVEESVSAESTEEPETSPDVPVPSIDRLSLISKQLEEVLAVTSGGRNNKGKGQQPRTGNNRGTGRNYSGPPDYSTWICYYCHKKGHIKRDCPNRPPPSVNRGRGRGAPGYMTRRGGYAQPFGPNRAGPYNIESEGDDQSAYWDATSAYSGNDYWGV